MYDEIAAKPRQLTSYNTLEMINYWGMPALMHAADVHVSVCVGLCAPTCVCPIDRTKRSTERVHKNISFGEG